MGEGSLTASELVELRSVFERAEVCREQWDWQIAAVVARLRAGSSWLLENPDGVSWTVIGQALGRSRQAMQQRFGEKSDAIWERNADEEEKELGVGRYDQQGVARDGGS